MLPFDSSFADEQASKQSILRTAAGWISECFERHVSCNSGKVGPDSAANALPTRVIDLSPTNGSSRACLFITKDASAQVHLQPYIALSHRWSSGSLNVVTTQANLQHMVEEIPQSRLPRTYLDAFEITRNLGVRYIWIDALCIIQDDRHDWQVESAKMCDVYRGAYCTIAATAAESSGQGCFMANQRPAPPAKSCRLVDEVNGSEIVLLPPTPAWKNQVLSSPLNKRAWVLQERLLSRRILHFAKDSVFFECLEMKSSQFEPKGIPDVELQTDPVSYTYSLSTLGAANCARSAWLQLVQHYTKLHITKIEDRLPALSGLAKMIQQETKDTYLAGLWKSSLVEGLAWSLSGKGFKPEELHIQRPYTAPSWSWASTDRNVGFLTETHTIPSTDQSTSAADSQWSSEVEILDIHMEMAGPDPTG